jgi:hypothetical protein
MFGVVAISSLLSLLPPSSILVKGISCPGFDLGCIDRAVLPLSFTHGLGTSAPPSVIVVFWASWMWGRLARFSGFVSLSCPQGWEPGSGAELGLRTGGDGGLLRSLLLSSSSTGVGIVVRDDVQASLSDWLDRPSVPIAYRSSMPHVFICVLPPYL